MDKQNVTLKSQSVAQDLEVIGHGGMVYEPCQIGEWWVMPAEQYTGKIPDDIMKKWDDFKAYAKAFNVQVQGYLIADDMREVIIKRELEAEEQRQLDAEEQNRKLALMAEQERQQFLAEQQRRKEEFDKTIRQVAEVTGQVLVGVGMAVGAVAMGVATVAVGVIGAILRFDPILIAVMEDGRWVCLGAWWD